MDKEALDRHITGNYGEDSVNIEDVAAIFAVPQNVSDWCIHPNPEAIPARLEYLRGELRAERISQGELLELQDLAEHIDPGDVELLEAAGVPEFPVEVEELTIEGTITRTLTDGTEVKIPFMIDENGNWHQWGEVTREQLGANVPLLDRLAAAVADV